MRPIALILALTSLAACTGNASTGETRIIRDTGGTIYSLENGVCIRRETYDFEDLVFRVPREACGVE